MTDFIPPAAQNLGRKAMRRALSLHKPLVRLARRHTRAREHEAFRREAEQVERQIAGVAAGTAPIVVGPWLAEVGYEVLYWVPFVRWFADAYRIAPERLIVMSRGGVDDWYRGVAATYVDIFEHMSIDDLRIANASRQATEANGGQKQSAPGVLDMRLVAALDGRGVAPHLLHPSLMFRLFHHVWHGNLPYDVLWRHTDFSAYPRPAERKLPALPERFIAVKFYTGTAIAPTPEHTAALRAFVEQRAHTIPIVTLDVDAAIDEHRDFAFDGLPNVISARQWLRPVQNLGDQAAIIARAEAFVTTCGGLAWMAPFLGVPTVAVFGDDHLLTSHLYVMRHALRRHGGAPFYAADLRAMSMLNPVV